MLRALVDGDTFKWRWAAAAEYDNYLCKVGDEEVMVRGKREAKKIDPEAELVEHVIDPLDHVLHSVKHKIAEIQKATGDESPRILLGKGECHRHEIYPLYKSSRSGREKPHHYDNVIEYLVDKWNAEIIEGVEVDDKLAMLQDDTTVIVSQDKDLLQVPGKHLHMIDMTKFTVSPKEADFNLYQQVITGDSTDDIPGIKGYGPVKAKKHLEGAESTDDLFSLALDLHGDFDALCLTGRLVYLLRHEDDDFMKRKEVVGFEDVPW